MDCNISAPSTHIMELMYLFDAAFVTTTASTTHLNYGGTVVIPHLQCHHQTVRNMFIHALALLLYNHQSSLTVAAISCN